MPLCRVASYLRLWFVKISAEFAAMRKFGENVQDLENQDSKAKNSAFSSGEVLKVSNTFYLPCPVGQHRSPKQSDSRGREIECVTSWVGWLGYTVQRNC